MAETCKGCSALQTEAWAKGKTAYRCMAEEAGQYRGRVVDTAKKGEEPSLILPAWCPRRSHG